MDFEQVLLRVRQRLWCRWRVQGIHGPVRVEKNWRLSTVGADAAAASVHLVISSGVSLPKILVASSKHIPSSSLSAPMGVDSSG
ncbi:hypothetical protein CLOM_g10769 [Closterium sp. NIES-68]|nr:hypothetical protein CLOM_g10769 [Closterium sp. NIES-68]GJP58085.1 hypothetical protein CLOP_g20419 [Closterium sp. NIES-67]